MNIIFCGGCINRQHNITPAQHYHAIVKQAIALKTATAPNSWQRFYSSFYELEKEATEMLQRDTHYNYLVIFLRPYTLMPLTKLLIRYTDNNMQQRLALSPKFSARKYYNNMMKEYKVPVQTQSATGLTYQVFQTLNDIAGDILGLHHWAHQQVINILTNIQAVAASKGTRLILLGPPLYPANQRVSKSCIELNNKIALFAAANQVIHVDMVAPAEKDENVFSMPDGKHINLQGHAFMAAGILECLTVGAPLAGALLP